MKNLRFYGTPPIHVVVVHGGPGAPGEMAPVARELSKDFGVLEPIQTRYTLQGQADELKAAIEDNCEIPVVLIGHSWGAMLAYIVSAQTRSLVKKLILVNSGVYEEKYAIGIGQKRMDRLSTEDRKALRSLLEGLAHGDNQDKDAAFEQVGDLIFKADSFDALPHEEAILEYQYDIYESVWKEATDLRINGQLLAIGKKIRCPVVAIHGEYDPHPAEGVKKPLSRVLKEFRFVIIKNCGHLPWLERQARDEFYKILRRELR